MFKHLAACESVQYQSNLDQYTSKSVDSPHQILENSFEISKPRQLQQLRSPLRPLAQNYRRLPIRIIIEGWP